MKDPSWIPAARLWLVLDREAAAPRKLPEVTEHAIQGGADAVLCRIKDAPLQVVRELSREVRSVCEGRDVPFIMSHYPEVAHELAADAVQLGVGDMPLSEVRGVVGTMPVGYSTHSVAEAAARFHDGASYVFLGPVFATPRKLKYGAPLGLDVIGPASKLAGPVVFIGGIDAHNAPQIVASGGQRIAVIRAMQQVEDIAEATRSLKQALLGS